MCLPLKANEFKDWRRYWSFPDEIVLAGESDDTREEWWRPSDQWRRLADELRNQGAVPELWHFVETVLHVQVFCDLGSRALRQVAGVVWVGKAPGEPPFFLSLIIYRRNASAFTIRRLPKLLMTQGSTSKLKLCLWLSVACCFRR